MKSIIESIYNCERTYFDEKIDTEEYNEADENFCAAAGKIFSTLTEEQQNLFREVETCYGLMESAGNSKKFKDGFILGFKLAEELLNS